MLVISRQIEESVMVGDDLRITVNAIRGDRVVLAFSERSAGREAATIVSLREDNHHAWDPDVKVTVVHVRGDRVRLGFTAPASVAVHRLEIYHAANPDSAWPGHPGHR